MYWDKWVRWRDLTECCRRVRALWRVQRAVRPLCHCIPVEEGDRVKGKERENKVCLWSMNEWLVDSPLKPSSSSPKPFSFFSSRRRELDFRTCKCSMSEIQVEFACSAPFAFDCHRQYNFMIEHFQLKVDNRSEIMAREPAIAWAIGQAKAASTAREPMQAIKKKNISNIQCISILTRRRFLQFGSELRKATLCALFSC